jgi:uncharacterized protein YjbI with pentapeptide repeats
VGLLLVLITLLFIWQIGLEARQDRLLVSLQRADLEDQKLREEIRNLQHSRGLIGSIPAYGALLTAVVTGTALFFTVRKEVESRAAERRQRQKEVQAEQERKEAERRQREKEVQAEQKRKEAERRIQEAENVRRFTESMRETIADLASRSRIRQAGAGASLMASVQTLLRPDSSDAFKDAVFFFIVTMTKAAARQSQDIRRLLVRSFEKAIRLRLTTLAEEDRTAALDLARCVLERVDLSGLDLSQADLAFAQLPHATLEGTNLRRVEGFGIHLESARLGKANLNEARLREAHCADAQFHEANLVSARLEEADLTNAEFYRARLQGAHLDGATLAGARFEGANVSDTFFLGARELDDVALDGLVRAVRRNAHFDPDVLAEIKRRSAAAGRGAKKPRAEPPAPKDRRPATQGT